MKTVYLIQARAGQPAGTKVELEDNLAVEAVSTGAARFEADHLAIQARDNELAKIKAKEKAGNLSKIEAALQRGVTRKALFPSGDGEKSLATVKAKMTKMFEEGQADADVVCQLIDYLPGEADTALRARMTTSVQARDNGVAFNELSRGEETLEESATHYVTAREPMNKLIREGKWDEARKISAESAFTMRHDIVKKGKIEAGGDFLLRNLVKAADFTDPDSQVGTLATGIVLQRNLGYLVNKLPFMKYISTDLSSEPAKFGTPLLTRYLTVPGVLKYVPGVGFTSDATTISTAGTGTTQSGGTTQGLAGTGPSSSNNYLTPVRSVPSTTDVTVTMDQLQATEVEFGIGKLASTARNLLGEQRGAQTYALAEAVNQHFLAKLYAATWTGTKTKYVKALDQWGLKAYIGIKNAMTISKIPDFGRFLLLHSYLYDKTLEDSNLLNAQAILALINRDGSAFNATDLPTLFGIKPLESQLSAANDVGVLQTWTDDTNPGSTNIVGFAGNMSSALFVSRPPQDYTKTAQELGVPLTASVELVTEPDSGLTVMVFKWADNGKMSIIQRVALMWGDAQGDPRQGFPIKLS